MEKAIGIVSKIFIGLFGIVWLILTVYPLIFVTMTGFKTNAEFFASLWSLPQKLNLTNFSRVLQTGFHRFFLNSLFISIASVLIIIITGAMASYAISRFKYKFSYLVFSLFLAGMMIPIHVTLVPVYKMTQSFGLYDTLFGLMGPYVAFHLPISIFILTGFMQDIPRDMEEAAYIDGANTWQIFAKVILPLSKPAISTIAIYNCLMLWNEFIYALVLISSRHNWNLTMGLWNFEGEFGIHIPLVMAALTLSILPVVILYAFMQDKITEGMMAGAIKG